MLVYIICWQGDIILEEAVKVTSSSNDELTPPPVPSPQNKGTVNPAMEYDAPMTSPTELLSPEGFPETDLNGNAMCGSNTMDYRAIKRSRSKSRWLVVAMLLFILTTLIMAGLFAWRMISFNEKKIDMVCYMFPSLKFNFFS